MSQLSIPNVFVTATTIQAAPFNQNFNAVAATVNNIDNTNIGVAGIFASQLIPTTQAQATFGGTLGYNFIAPSAGTTPLSIAGIGGQSANILTVALTSGGTSAFSINDVGTATFGFAPVSPNGGTFIDTSGTGQVKIGAFSASSLGDDGSVQIAGGFTGLSVGNRGTAFANRVSSWGLNGGTASGSLLGAGTDTIGGVTGSFAEFLNNGVAALFVLNTSGSAAFAGTLEASSNVSAVTYVPPVYTAGGTATASTLHAVTGTGTLTGTNVTVTLSGAAQFSSATSYVVLAFNSSTGNVALSFSLSATQFVITSSGGTTGNTVTYFAIGT